MNFDSNRSDGPTPPRRPLAIGESAVSRRILLIAAGACVLAGIGFVTLQAKGTLTSPESAPATPQPDDLTSLVDQESESFSLPALSGRTVVLNFIFTHCRTSCPLHVKALTAVQRALPDALQRRVQFVSVSVDPKRDTPAVLKQYALKMGADLGNWSFVTGAEHEITRLHQHFGAQVKRLDGDQFDHRVAVYLLDANGRFVQRYSGDLDRPRLVKEIAEVDSLYNKTRQ